MSTAPPPPTLSPVPRRAPLPSHPPADRLVVRGAREHNLKDVSLDLPRDALIVFTGLSGSGKSSLAVDTIFQLQAVPGSDFVFRPDTLHPFGPVMTFEVDLLLDDSARRLDEWKRIADELPATSAVLAMPLELPSGDVGAALTRDEWTVLAACDGRRTVGDLIVATGLRPLDVMKLTHHLLRAGRLHEAPAVR